MTGERRLLAVFTLREGLRRTVRVLGAPFRLFIPSLGRGTSDRMVIAPQDLRTTDPTIASDIYAGYFAFGGKVVAAEGRSPFEVNPPDVAWAEELMSFGWLRHLRAAETALARSNARALVDDWITMCRRPRGVAWETGVVARRLMSWITQSPLVLEGADRDFYRRFMRSIGKQARFLGQVMDRCDCPDRRLRAAVALCYVALATQGTATQLRRTTQRLAAELDLQLLPDGGHLSRNPTVLLELLADLLPLRQVFQTQGIEPPQELMNAVDRIGPMLRLFRHGDGTLALFNGVARTPTDVLATVLAYQDVRAQAMENALHSGFQRVQGGTALLVMDAGPPPPEAYSGFAHAGCLSFEFSDGMQKIIVNCGSPPPGFDQYRAAARTTAAHSTLLLDDTSSCSFAPVERMEWPRGAPIIGGPKEVTCTRETDLRGTTLSASHDGYAARGVRHERTVFLSSDGNRVEGMDILSVISEQRAAKHGDDFTVRFHLQPGTEAFLLEGREGVMLRTANGKRWFFDSRDVPASVEDDLVFAVPDGARRTTRIVLAGSYRTTPALRWSLTRSQSE